MLLLTAFEPFDGTGINSSQEAMREFLQRHPDSINGLPVAGVTLPVVYEADVAALLPTWERLQPRAILHLGQTSGSVVGVERVALNLKLLNLEEARRDGQPPRHAPIFDEDSLPATSDTPAALFSTLPVASVVDALLAADVPAADSAHAGTYLCNHILFRSLRHARSRGLPISIGFVHLPRLPQQVSALKSDGKNGSLPVETLVRAIEVCAAVIADCVLSAGEEESASRCG